MKKNRMMRLASILMIAVLMTTCTISGTFAKYVSAVSANDTARVAKWGVELTADADVFKPTYNGTSGVAVKADDDTDVIAPGTTGTATIFTIAGAPEVDVDVVATLGAYTIATLPAGTYKDYTNQNPGTPDYVLGSAYKPVKWTLTKVTAGIDGIDGNGDDQTNVEVAAQNLDAVQTYLTGISTRYEVESNEFADIVGEYTLTWDWAFEVDDKADTFMGQVAAGVAAAPAGYVGNESFAFSLTVTQVD